MNRASCSQAGRREDDCNPIIKESVTSQPASSEHWGYMKKIKTHRLCQAQRPTEPALFTVRPGGRLSRLYSLSGPIHCLCFPYSLLLPTLFPLVVSTLKLCNDLPMLMSEEMQPKASSVPNNGLRCSHYILVLCCVNFFFF